MFKTLKELKEMLEPTEILIAIIAAVAAVIVIFISPFLVVGILAIRAIRRRIHFLPFPHLPKWGKVRVSMGIVAWVSREERFCEFRGCKRSIGTHHQEWWYKQNLKN